MIHQRDAIKDINKNWQNTAISNNSLYISYINQTTNMKKSAQF